MVHVGTNNLRSARTKKDIACEIKDLIIKGKKLFPKAKWAVSGVICRSDVAPSYVWDVNQLIKAECEGIECKFTDPNMTLGRKEIGKDGLHLNRVGSWKLGTLMIDTIKLLLESGN